MVNARGIYYWWILPEFSDWKGLHITTDFVNLKWQEADTSYVEAK